MQLLPKQKADSLKGIFAIAILLCHLCGRTGIGSQIGLGPIYTAMGYWSVSVFFCISGYGLAYSFKNRENYLNNFIRKKVFPLFLLYVFLVIFYFLLKVFFLTLPDPFHSFIRSFCFGETLVSNGWYIQVILMFYLLLFSIYRFIKSDTIRISLMFITILIYIFTCRHMGLSSTWYESTLCFPLGVLLYNCNSVICKTCVDRRRYYVSILLICLFIISFFTYYLVNSHAYSIIPKIISSVTFALVVIYLSHFIYLRNRLTDYLSQLYLEIYLLQGGVFILLT